MDRRQAVRHWVLVPAFAGSNPAGPAIFCAKTSKGRDVGLTLFGANPAGPAIFLCYTCSMEHNSYPSNPEAVDETNTPNTPWDELKDVDFRGAEVVEEEVEEESEEREPRKRPSEIIRIVSEQEMQRSGEFAMRPRAEISCDHGHIECQKIDVIDKRDKGLMEFSFKLRKPTDAIKEIVEIAKELYDDKDQISLESGATIRKGQIFYEGASNDGSYALCDAVIVEKDGVRVLIADPTARGGDSWNISTTDNDSRQVRTAIGLIKVEFPSGMSPEKTEQILGDILVNDLGIPDALDEVPDEAEREYKIARYKWQHNLSGELTAEETATAERLEQEEVFPGYVTFVEKGRHREYLEQFGDDVRAVHSLSTGDAKSIYRVLTQGLMCTTERYSRGVIRDGMSSKTDMDTGGADSVFTRVMKRERREKQHGTMIVFKPELFDRTDWYSYDCDRYGSTDDSSFPYRLSPDKLFEKALDTSWFSGNNEQMFRTGIGARYIESIEVQSPAFRDKVIAGLREMGLTEFDGRPIDEVIVVRPEQANAIPDTFDWPSLDTDTQSGGLTLSVNEFIAKHEADMKAFEEKKAKEKAEKMQAIINGEVAYSSIDELIDVAWSSGDFDGSFKSMLDAIIMHGDKEKLTEDFTEWLKETVSLDDLKKMAMEQESSDPSVAYAQKVLNLDYEKIYNEALDAELEALADEDFKL